MAIFTALSDARNLLFTIKVLTAPTLTISAPPVQGTLTRIASQAQEDKASWLSRGSGPVPPDIPPGQWLCFSRNIGRVNLEMIYIHNLKNMFWIKVSQKHFIQF